MPKKPGVGVHSLDDLTTKEQRAYDALTEKEKYELRRRPWRDKGMQGDKSHPYVENIQWKPTVHSVEWHMSGFSGEPIHKPRQKYCTRHSKPYQGDFARSLDIPMEPALARRLAQEKAIADELIPKPKYKEGAKARTLAAMEEEEKQKLLIHPSFCGGSTFSKGIRIAKEKFPQDLLEECGLVLGAGFQEKLFKMMFRGKVLKRGKPLYKQGMTGKHDKDGKDFYRVLLLPQPQATEATDEIFWTIGPSYLYSYLDDPDVTDPYTGEMRLDRAPAHRAGEAYAEVSSMGVYDPTKSRADNAASVANHLSKLGM